MHIFCCNNYLSTTFLTTNVDARDPPSHPTPPAPPSSNFCSISSYDMYAIVGKEDMHDRDISYSWVLSTFLLVR